MPGRPSFEGNDAPRRRPSGKGRLDRPRSKKSPSPERQKGASGLPGKKARKEAVGPTFPWERLPEGERKRRADPEITNGLPSRAFPLKILKACGRRKRRHCNQGRKSRSSEEKEPPRLRGKPFVPRSGRGGQMGQKGSVPLYSAKVLRKRKHVPGKEGGFFLQISPAELKVGFYSWGAGLPGKAQKRRASPHFNRLHHSEGSFRHPKRRCHFFEGNAVGEKKV